MRTVLLLITTLLIPPAMTQAKTVLTVSQDGTENFTTIQAAINAANDGDTVMISDGVYTGQGNRDIDFLGKAITVRSRYGAEKCIIDCQATEQDRHRGFVFQSGEGANSVLKGVTITNGYGLDEMYNNSVYCVGGGIFCSDSSPTITKCILTGNSTKSGYGLGGGIFCYLGNPSISTCVIRDNHEGGGIFMWGDLSLAPKTASRITNCLVTGNDRIGIGCFQCPAVITNCTLADNEDIAAMWFFAFHLPWETPPVVKMTNCILWGNSKQMIYANAVDNIKLSYCNVRGGWGGTGNINANPLFVGGGNYHLTAESPCIDKGTNNPVGVSMYHDIEYNMRPMDGDDDGTATVDMGAYEYSNSPPIADAGEDMTAYACVDGFGVVEPNGFGSFDADGDELSYLWSWEVGGEVYEANGVMPLISLPVGDHTLELVVFDGGLYSEADSVLVTVVEAVEARGFVVPRVVNLSSRGKFVMAVLYLPDGIGKGDIVDGSFGLYVDGGGTGVPAERQMVIGGGNGGRMFVVFDRAAVIEAVGGRSTAKVYVAGALVSGECMFAADSIRLVRSQRRLPRRSSGGRGAALPRDR